MTDKPDRDAEIDEVMKELRGTPTPHIEKPPFASISDGSACWLDVDRACGPDCRAYDISVQPPSGPQVCTLLSSLGDIADSMVGFVEIGRTIKKAQADKTRTTAATGPVPDPTGKKTG